MSAASRLFLWSSVLQLIFCWSFRPEPSHPVAEDGKISHSTDMCRDHPYKTHLISKDPLVIYIESFITTDEASQLVGLKKSTVDSTYRSSLTASLERHDIVRCIEERARAFPAYDSPGLIKPLVVQRYGISNQSRDHYHWFTDGPYLDGNIESTFFVYIQANCTGGGTNFPRLKALEDENWCDFIDCDQPLDTGITFKPIMGIAIFWKNLHPDGQGHKANLHAGLPLTSGMKTGLNI